MAHSHPKITHPAQAIATCQRTQVITYPKVKQTQEEMEKREDRKATEDRAAEKNQLLSHSHPSTSTRWSITLLLSSFQIPPQPPLRQKEFSKQSQLNKGACTPPLCAPQLCGHKQSMFSPNCPVGPYPVGTRKKQNKSSLGGGVQPRAEEQDPNTEAPTYSDSRKRAVLMILFVAST